MQSNNQQVARLEARLSSEQKQLIQHAADLLGRSLTDFVVSVSQEAAAKVIREHEIITLNIDDSKNFINALLHPPKPNAALKKAAKRYQKFKNKE